MTSAAPAAHPRNPMLDVIARRDFRLLWIGQGTSFLGDQFAMIALPWLVLQLTDDPQALRAEAPKPQRRIETLRIDPALEQQQVERVRQLRAARDTSRWSAAIDTVRAAARSTDNLVPPIIAAVEARATVGEIADAMREVFGEHRETDA